MNNNHEYRFLLFLFIGGLIFSYWQKVPTVIYEKMNTSEVEFVAQAEDTQLDNAFEWFAMDKIEELQMNDSVSDNQMYVVNIDEKTGNVSHNHIGWVEEFKTIQAEKKAKEEAAEKERAEAEAEAKREMAEKAKKLNTEAVKPVEEREEREFCLADDDYFDDACFIGDSRTVGLYMYSGWNADFYCSSGMTLKGVFGPPSRIFHDGNWKENIADALQREKYKKVYIILGINDMGIGNADTFMEQYTNVVASIRQWQPDAIIYVNGILKVSASRNAQGGSINNADIMKRNERIKELDNGYDIIYLDPNEALCDESGNLKAEWTFDGVHLYAKYLYHWTEYIKEHAYMKKKIPIHKLGNN